MTSNIFNVGKWIGFKVKGNEEGAVLFKGGVETQATALFSNAASCSRIISKNCASSYDDRLYCVENNSAGTETYITYYSLPSCDRLKMNSRMIIP